MKILIVLSLFLLGYHSTGSIPLALSEAQSRLLFPSANIFCDPSISDESLGQQIAKSLEFIFGLKINGDFQTTLIKAVKFSVSEFRLTKDESRLSVEMAKEKLSLFFGGFEAGRFPVSGETFELLARGVVACLALPGTPHPRAEPIISAYNAHLQALFAKAKTQRIEKEKIELVESLKMKMAVQTSEKVKQYLEIRYLLVGKTFKAIEAISIKASKHKTPPFKMLKERVGSLLKVFVRAGVEASRDASTDGTGVEGSRSPSSLLEDNERGERLISYLAALAGVVGGHRKGEIADEGYLPWNADILQMIIDTAREQGGLFAGVRVAKDALKGIAGSIPPVPSEKLLALMEKIVEVDSPKPEFPDQSLKSHVNRLIFIDLINLVEIPLNPSTPQTPNAPTPQQLNVSTPKALMGVAPPSLIGETLSKFSDLVALPSCALISHGLARLYIRLPEGEAFFDALSHPDALGFLRSQLAALYAFRVTRCTEATGSDQSEIARQFDVFLSTSQALDLEPYFPFLKIANALIFLKNSETVLHLPSPSPKTLEFVEQTLPLPEFAELAIAIQTVTALAGTKGEGLRGWAVSGGITFPASIFSKPKASIKLEQAESPKKTKSPSKIQSSMKELVNVITGRLPKELEEAIETSKHFSETVKDLAPNMPFDMVVGTVRRPVSPCFE